VEADLSNLNVIEARVRLCGWILGKFKVTENEGYFLRDDP